MIDYHAHLAILERLRADAAGAVATAPAGPDRDALADLLAAVATEEDAALLGTFVDHVIVQAASDGTESDLLARAAALWTRGLDLYTAVGQVRDAVEQALTAPEAPGAVDAFNGATALLAAEIPEARDLTARALALREDLRPLKHIPPHPRQDDLPLTAWNWGDVFLARRGDAYVRTMFDAAREPGEAACAFGVLAAYGGNAAGSAYQGRAVGGPRRNHRFRDRLARNAIGSWCARHYALPTPGQLATRLAAFDADSAAVRLLGEALAHAYDPDRTPPPPDPALGIRRVRDQLTAFDTIRRPALPAPPVPEIAIRIAAGATGGAPTPDTGKSWPRSGDDGSGTGSGTGTGVTGTDGSDQTGTDKSGDGGCLAFFAALLVTSLVLGIACLVGLATKGDCGKGIEDVWDAVTGKPKGGDNGEPPPALTQEQLTVLATTDGGPHFAQHLFEVQLVLWQAFDQALDYLALVGLVPPDDLAMASPLYGQFVSLPARPAWPLRPVAAPETGYFLDPTAPVENPQEQPSPYPTGADPSVFVDPTPGAAFRTGPGIALALLWQIARREHDSVNLDLDADRGFGHRCWTVPDGRSVLEDPVPVVDLGYGEL
ncbi:hypothetical protein [Embleya sp. NPDC020630]|uniref:hypothetical protein n=1 Tax=Embleya sp. NPDC020630 TaxID=3363979 RepID=UPI00378B6468